MEAHGFEGAIVTGGNPRYGRQDNGLYATDYAAVADVDPRVGEHLLDVLGNRGIAAYLQPTSDQHPITRLTTLPGRPTDRLYVDRSEVDTAREFLEILAADEGDSAATAPAEQAPVAPATRTGDDFEDAWASIVAGFDETADHSGSDVAPWPEIEDKPAPEPPPKYPRWRASGASFGSADDSLLSGLDSFGADLADDDDDETYHPPPPPPLPRFAMITIASIIAIIGGITLIADPNLLSIDTAQTEFLGCAAILAGAVGLIGRLRSGGPDDDDDHNNGAIV